MPVKSQDILLDRYQLLERLGSGGFSVVDLAWDMRMQRRVAIKRMQLPALYGKHQSLIEDELPGLLEARTAAMLQNPHIVTVHDFEIAGDEALLIMEHLDGLSLREIMEQATELLDIDVVTAIISGVGDALAFAHANQILHLDIKPDNIMVDQAGIVKVTDFGLAEFVNHASSKIAQGGSIGYMPLEQMAGEAVTEQTDEWALAAVVYEMLTGENPFEQRTIKESAEVIERSQLIVPSALHPDLSPEIDDVIFQALSIEPHERYTTVKRFVGTLKKLLGNVTQGKKKLREIVAESGVVNTESLDPARYDEQGLVYDADGQIYHGGLDDEEVADETVFHDSSGTPYYKDGNGDPYYLDKNGDPFYYDENDEPYYLDEEGRPYQLDKRGRAHYWEETGATQTAYSSEDPRREQQRAVKEQRKQERESNKNHRKIDHAYERDARRRNRRSFLEVSNNCIGNHGAMIALRTTSALTSAVLVYLGLGALGADCLLSLPFTFALVLTAIVGITGGFLPLLGLVIGVLLACLGLILHGWILLGCISTVVVVIWFIAVGRHAPALVCCSLLSPLLGLFSLGFAQPLIAGYLLSRREALVSAASGVFVMFVFAPLTTSILPIASILASSTSMINAQLFQNGTVLITRTDNLASIYLQFFSNPATWIVAAAWVLSAVCVSLLSKDKGNLASFCAGLIACALLVISRMVVIMFSKSDSLVGLPVFPLVGSLVVFLVLSWLYKPSIAGSKRRRR